MQALKVTELGDYLKEQRQNAKLSLRQLAEVAGVSNPYLSQVERGLRKPSAEVLQQIAKGLRISAEALYVRAGILEDKGDRAEVEAAVMADPGLTERQRRVLLDIYASFRAENERGAASSGASATPSPRRRRTAAKQTSTRTAAGTAASTTRRQATRKQATQTKKPTTRGER